MNFNHCIPFFRLEDFAEGAAKVDVTECTQDWKRYEDPDNANIEYWDLPGMGTEDFPAKTYFQDVKLNEYDTFVILTDTRFTKDDLELANKITLHGKKYFFVRLKIDQDVRNAKRSSRPESFNEGDVLAKIRSKCVAKLGDLLSNKEKIFLISCHGFEKRRETGEKCGEKYREKYQLEPLIKANRDALHQNQQDAIIRLLEEASMAALEENVKVLGGDIWKSSALSGVAAVIPVVSIGVDIWLIKRELNRYKTALGIPEEESDEFKKLDPTSKAKVSVTLKLLTEFTAKSAGALAVAYTVETRIEEAFAFLPAGLIIACPLSGITTYKVLDYILKTMADTAFAILAGVIKSKKKKIACTANVFRTSVSLTGQHS